MHFDFRAPVPNRLFRPIKTRYVPNNWSSAQISRYSTDSNELAGTSYSRQATNTGQPHRNQHRKNKTTKKDIVCKYFGTQDGNYKKSCFVTANLGRLDPLRPGVFFRIPPRRRIYLGHQMLVLCCAPCPC